MPSKATDPTMMTMVKTPELDLRAGALPSRERRGRSSLSNSSLIPASIGDRCHNSSNRGAGVAPQVIRRIRPTIRGEIPHEAKAVGGCGGIGLAGNRGVLHERR